MKTNVAVFALLAVPFSLACPTHPKTVTVDVTVTASSTVVAESSSTSSVSKTSTSIVPEASTSAALEPTTIAVVTTVATSATSTSSTAPVATPTGTAVSSSAAITGTSTFYGGNLSGGTCSFSTYTLPAGIFGTAFSGSAWDSAAECGACLEVTANGKSILVMVVDECPECDAGHLDLFENAFEVLSPLSAGLLATSYTPVACGITSPLVLHNKSGTSQYFFSMQVVNSNEPVASLEVSTDGGSTFQSTERQDFNFFEITSGTGTDTVTVRVTSTSGKTIVVDNVGVASGSQITAESNF
ncbi:carbohydrate-binding module family 63 protein [Xylariaceae sp. FL0255]|nr:carbohydrate-binding module family 63 protein [Xylariaceae sp. FL0255]